MSSEKPKKTGTQLAPYRPKSVALVNPQLRTVEDYIRAANAFALLTPEREHELAVRLRDTGDPEAAGELIMSHLRLVVSIARQYLGYGLPFSDLIQEGNIGLMKAVKRFNPDQGTRLVTFAMTWIRSEIQEYVIRNWRLVRVATTKNQRKLFFNLRALKDDTARLKLEQAESIAEKLDVKPSEVFEMEQRMMGREVTIDEPADNQAEAMTPSEWLYEEDDEPDRQIERAQKEALLASGLPEAIKKLDPRSRRIIEARWMYDEASGQKGLTLADLAQEFGISQERVRQIEKKAMAELKEYLSS